MNLPDLLNLAIDNRLAELHTCLPGRIESYSPATCKAAVKPLLKKVYSDGETASLPVITNVPVIFPRSGAASLTFPLASGDGVLLVFSERSLDEWLSQGGETAPDDPRRFDLSDCLAIPGLYPFSDANPEPAGTNLVLAHNGGKLVINPAGQVALGNSTDELLALLGEFLDAVATALCAAPGSPLSTSALLLALQPRLAAITGSLT